MLPRQFLRKCRQFLFKKKIADSTGVEMTGGALLMRTLIFRRILLRNGIAADEQFVGVLVPPSAGGVLANTAVTVMRRVPVNLNYTVTSDTLNSVPASALDCQPLRHIPATQVSSEPGHALPHIPQWYGSLVRSLHAVTHSTRCGGTSGQI